MSEERVRMKAKIIRDSKFGFVGLIENEDVYERFRNDEVKFKKEPKYIQIPYKVFKRLIDADKKQIPKKVQKSRCDNCDTLKTKDYSRCIDCEYDWEKCPNCKQIIQNDSCFEYPHCPYCGQALDWSEYDEN